MLRRTPQAREQHRPTQRNARNERDSPPHRHEAEVYDERGDPNLHCLAFTRPACGARACARALSSACVFESAYVCASACCPARVVLARASTRARAHKHTFVRRGTFQYSTRSLRRLICSLATAFDGLPVSTDSFST